MYQNEGYWDVKPKIKAVSFPKRGKIEVTLQDDRSITMPISAFPSIKKVPVKERKTGISWEEDLRGIHVLKLSISNKFWVTMQIMHMREHNA